MFYLCVHSNKQNISDQAKTINQIMIVIMLQNSYYAINLGVLLSFMIFNDLKYVFRN